MAKQSKKILHKIEPHQDEQKKPTKPSRDIFLILVICFTIVVLGFGWTRFGILDRGMYIMLAISLVLTYMHKHADVSDEVMTWLDRISMACIAAALGIFAVICYNTFMH
jgi:hypothetical protein